jgi:radical SAM superfamily enzyme YgiQ (UPF0313 family)
VLSGTAQEKSVKVLLVYAVPDRAFWPRGVMSSQWVPLGLAYLARALLDAGHDVRIHVREEQLVKNGFDWDDADARLRSLMESFRPEMVGISALTPMVPDAGAVAATAKEACGADTLTVIGGIHATALPEETLDRCQAIDVAVVGEGERTIVELAERGPSREIAGIVFRDGEGFVRTPPRAPVTDLDTLGSPPFELFDMSYYTGRGIRLIRFLPLRALNIRTTRGCPNRCIFCAGHAVSGLGVRCHSLDYVMDQLSTAADRFGVEAVHFEDETFGHDHPRLLELCERMRKADLPRRIKWSCLLRVDQADAKLLSEMKAAGCIQVEYGFESGSSDALRRIGKNATTELNRRAVTLTREAGMRVFANIMFNLPGETAEEFDATVAFVRWAKAEILSANCMFPVPGSALYRTLATDVRQSVAEGGVAYFDHPGDEINMSAMTDEQLARRYRRFVKHVYRPQLTWALLRDKSVASPRRRRRMWAYLAKFALKHPVRAIRAPW